MALRTHQVVMLFVLTAVLVGNSFLTSSGQGVEEGAVPWSSDSLLQPLVEVLNLRYAFPTPLGVEVKSWVFGAGAAAAMLVAVLGWYVFCVQAGRRSRGLPDGAAAPGGAAEAPKAGAPAPRAVAIGPNHVTEASPVVEEAPRASLPAAGRLGGSMSALTGAQLMFCILVVYSFISANWSVAWDISLGGSVVLGAQIAWAVSLGRGLNRRAARLGARILLVVVVLTAALAVWYFYERNPAFRAKYPIGNPLFLAAMLLPAILLCASGLGSRLQKFVRRPGRATWWVGLAAGLGALAILLWCLVLTGGRPPAEASLAVRLKTLVLAGSRAGLLGLGVGALALPFMLAGKRGKIALGAATALAVLVVITVMVPRWQEVAQFGRGATVRLRLYAWSYAVQMVERRTLTGVGQGGYTLLADGPDFAGRDAVGDPLAMQGHLAHAHNEWIETWADLGTLGLAFLIAGYLLTFVAGAWAVRGMDRPGDRWVLAGLLASLAALGVEECASVGLRLPGLPAVYYTVLGLTWAMCRRDDSDQAAVGWCPGPAVRRLVLLSVTGLALSSGSLYYRDWAGVRAEYEARVAFRQSHYDQALRAARFAASARLEPHRRLEARVRLAGTYAGVAGAYLRRAQRRQARARAGEIDVRVAEHLIQEDCERARGPLDAGLELTERLRRGFAGGYTDLGMIEADLYVFLGERAVLQGQDTGETLDELRRRAAAALKTELRRNRFSEELALRYLRLAVGIPVTEQIEVLCGPLRGGSSGSGLYLAAEQLAGQGPFADTLRGLLALAERDLRAQDPLEWRNIFSPEVCRLAAALQSRLGRYDSAVELLDRAIRLYGQGRNGELLRLCRAQAIQEQGWFAFLSDLPATQRARLLTESAIETVPPIGKAELLRRPMYAQLVTLAAAARDEAAARAWARRIHPDLEDEAFKVMLGNNYAVVAELCLERDLPAGSDFLERARHLAPNEPRVLWTEADYALQEADDQRLVYFLGRLIARDDPRRVTAYLQSALAARPGSRALLEFYEQMVAEERIPPMTADSVPSAGPLPAPATRPADRPAPLSPPGGRTAPGGFDSTYPHQ